MPSRVGSSAAAVVSFAVVTGCLSEAPEPPQETQDAPAQAVMRPGTPPIQYEFMELTLPSGNASEGRDVFIELRCAVCHQVEGESELPEPVSTTVGPILGPALASQPLGALATAIVAPSHAMSIRTSPDTRDQVQGVLSPMGDYSESMTVRQLLDLLAYLETVRR